MPSTVDELPGGGTGERTIRVDTWDGTNRHWVYYFVETSDGEFKPKTYAISPYNPTETEFDDQGLETAIEALEEWGDQEITVDTSSIDGHV